MPDSRCGFGGRIGREIVGFRGEFVRFSLGGGMRGGDLEVGVSYWLLWDSCGIDGCLNGYFRCLPPCRYLLH